MINIKNIDNEIHNIKDTKGEFHYIDPGSIITIPRTMISPTYLLQCVEQGFFIVFPNNNSTAVKKEDEELSDRFGLMDLEE